MKRASKKMTHKRMFISEIHLLPLKTNNLKQMKKNLVFAILLVLVGLQFLSAQESAKQKPNIIFILTDDQRWSALGYAGNELATTPEMDKLAESGAYFKHAVVTTPICSASRASIFTGLHERTHKYTFQTGDIRSEYMETSYPKILKQAGYYTGFYGKFGVKYPDMDKLFDVIEDYDRANQYNDYRGYYYKTLNGDTVHLTRYTGQKALDFIDNVPADQPFSLSLCFSAPHAHDGAPLQYSGRKNRINCIKIWICPNRIWPMTNIFMPCPKLYAMDLTAHVGTGKTIHPKNISTVLKVITV
jgi:hypothetical protein